MEKIKMWYYVILGIIVVVGIVIGYIVYIRQRNKKDKDHLQGFLRMLSQSFQTRWTSHYKDPSPTEYLAEFINTKIRIDIGKGFKMTIISLRRFPKKSFMFFIDDPINNRYISKMFDTTKRLYEEYRSCTKPLDDANREFFNESQKIIVKELEKNK